MCTYVCLHAHTSQEISMSTTVHHADEGMGFLDKSHLHAWSAAPNVMQTSPRAPPPSPARPPQDLLRALSSRSPDNRAAAPEVDAFARMCQDAKGCGVLFWCGGPLILLLKTKN